MPILRFFKCETSNFISLTALGSIPAKGSSKRMNCGLAAGQTVMQFHCHLIPRYTGDVENPRGGVRHSVIGKGYY